MAADCRAIINSPYVEESIVQPKLIVIPNGPKMGVALEVLAEPNGTFIADVVTLKAAETHER